MRFALILVLACGGKPAPKPPPQVSPAETLAKQLDDDLSKLAELAHGTADCSALADRLRPHVETMKVHAGEVATMMSDPAKARELKAALAPYATAAATRTDQLAKDLGATYLACADKDAKYRLEKAISDMPTYE